MAHDLKANLEINDPLKKAAEKLRNKNGIHTPTISNPYMMNTPPPQAPTEQPKTAATIKTDTESTEQKKQKGNKTLHTFFIDEDLFFTLKAIATYTKTPLNNIVNTALEKHIKEYDKETIATAKDIYKQIIELTKGGIK